MKRNFKTIWNQANQDHELHYIHDGKKCSKVIEKSGIMNDVVNEYSNDNIVCVHHDNCLDGYTAAYHLKTVLPNAKLVPGSYSKELDHKFSADETVFFVDFSTKRDRMIKIANIVKRVIIIDHHKTARRELVNLPGNVDVVFDMNHSGAVLTYNYFILDRVPLITRCVEDRDLWKFIIKDSNKVTSYMRTLDFSIEEWDRLYSNGINTAIDIGTVLEKKQRKDVAAMVKSTAREAIVDGHKVLVANMLPTYISDAGNKMVKMGYPFAVLWFINSEGVLAVSFRADGKYDVSELAMKYGGGGHANSSGCSLQEPIWEFEKGEDNG